MTKMEINTSNLLMFISMFVLGLKANPNYPGLGKYVENLFNETFDKKLNE